MKKSFLAVIVIAVMVTFISCDNQPADQQPESALTLIKFKNPSYVNNLIVTDYDNSDVFLLMRGNNCSKGYLTNTSGKDWIYDFPSLEKRTPYIELTDGWYLVDWSWRFYPYNGQVLLTDVTWDNYNGEYSFDKSIPHISKNIYDRKDIPFIDLVAYSFPDGNYPTFIFRSLTSNTGEEYSEELNEYLYISQLYGGDQYATLGYLNPNGNCLCNRVEEMDDLWDLLRTQLINVIKNGDLKSLPRATKEQRMALMGLKEE